MENIIINIEDSETTEDIEENKLNNDEKLNDIFDEIDVKSEVGEFTQDEPQQEDQEVEEEEI